MGVAFNPFTGNFDIKGSGGVVGSGDVVGPASSLDSKVVLFDGVTGKLIKDSGLSLSGSNTGDQTSIVGITGTKAQFDTAVSDGNILYVGDVVGVTDGDKGDITVSTSGTTWTLDLRLHQILAPTGSVDFSGQQATNFRVENRTSDPGTPTVGQVWLRTDL